jgi:sulfate transport system permease protein
VVSGNVAGRTQTATLVVDDEYVNFAQPEAYATAFLLAIVSVVCIVVVSFLRPKHQGGRS